jgi:hypothetical protein
MGLQSPLPVVGTRSDLSIFDEFHLTKRVISETGPIRYTEKLDLLPFRKIPFSQHKTAEGRTHDELMKNHIGATCGVLPRLITISLVRPSQSQQHSSSQGILPVDPNLLLERFLWHTLRPVRSMSTFRKRST